MDHLTQHGTNATRGPALDKVSDLPPTLASNPTRPVLQAMADYHRNRRARAQRSHIRRRHQLRRHRKPPTRSGLLPAIALAAITLALQGCLTTTNLTHGEPPMGSPVPTIPVIGGTCAICDGALWPLGQTPHYLRATVQGIQQCPGAPYPPPSGIFILEQQDPAFCIWSLVAPPYFPKYRVWPDRTCFHIWDTATQSFLWFGSANQGCSYAGYTNLLEDCLDPQHYGRFGSAIIEFAW